MAGAVNIKLSLDVPKATIPPSVDGKTLSATSQHAYPVDVTPPPASTASNSEYYAALRTAVLAAKEDMGRTLTAWRDAVGDGEKEKEIAVVGKKGKKGKKVDEELDEEELEVDDE